MTRDYILSKLFIMILLFILSVILKGFPMHAQCDLELLDFDPVEGSVTVAFLNTENCGGAGAPDGVSELQFGFQAIDEDCNAMNTGWDFPSFDFPLSATSNHPGWIYSATTTESPTNWTNLYDESLVPPYYSGDTVTFPIFNSYQSDCVNGPFAGQMYCNLENVITYWYTEGYSIQAVIWQISYGQTMYASDGGWAEVGVNGDGTPWGTGLYEDNSFQDNWVVVGDCGEPIPEVVIDTIYVELPPDTVTLIEYDTTVVYVELPPDTVYQTLILYDTIINYVELPPDTITVPINWYFYDTTYVYTTDTLIEYSYEYDMVEVDCETGSPCISPYEGCDIYIPNSFTPDNDGVNDYWGAYTDDSCWISWILKVFSRSGEVVWEGFHPDDIWIGGDEYYLPSDVYVYRLQCEGYGESYVINGHVSLIR